MAQQTFPYDAAKYLASDQEQAEYLALAFESGEEALIKKSLSTVARARGMAEVAKDADLSRQGLYKSLSDNGDPRLSTLLAVLRALGMHVSVRPIPSTASDKETGVPSVAV